MKQELELPKRGGSEKSSEESRISDVGGKKKHAQLEVQLSKEKKGGEGEEKRGGGDSRSVKTSRSPEELLSSSKNLPCGEGVPLTQNRRKKKSREKLRPREFRRVFVGSR